MTRQEQAKYAARVALVIPQHVRTAMAPPAAKRANGGDLDDERDSKKPRVEAIVMDF